MTHCTIGCNSLTKHMHFDISLQYRSQSEPCSASRFGRLAGEWRTIEMPLLQRVARFVAESALEAPPVGLRTADIFHRSGVFQEIGDALYYDAFSSSPGLPSDVLDCTKLVEHWHRRRALLEDVGLIGLVNQVEADNTDVSAAAASEYVLHEVGHRLGYGLFDKQKAGFFQLAGRLSWPLVYFEEHRADMMAFQAAGKILSQHSLRVMVAYHLAHRLGLALESRRPGHVGAGLVPLLLMKVLIDRDLLTLETDGARSVARLTTDFEGISTALSDHARQLADLDRSAKGQLVELAIRHGTYIRDCLADECTVNSYNRLVA